MRRRSRAGGEPVKTRRRKTVTLKRRNATKSVHGRSSSVAVFQEQLDRRTHELSEALEQQKATAEILRVIRTSPADVQPVFETIVRNAVSLCGSVYAHVFRFDGELLHLVASHNVAPSPWRHYADYLKAKYPMRPNSSQVSGRVLLKKSVVRLENALADPDYDQRSARGGWRRALGVPMLREGEPLGVIVVGWTEAGPVPKVQEELLKTFADQAVIAIENVRLFEAEQQRSRELSELLEQQTATADVLGVISSSPGELEPVFRAMLENATRICGAKFGNLWLAKDGGFQLAATHGLPPEFQDQVQHKLVLYPGPKLPIARAASTREPVHILDLRTDPSYVEREPIATVGVERGQVRTMVAVPMLKDRDVVGVFAILRQEVLPFVDKQIELLQNFAAQAVIAIENTRLLSELRQRTDDLTESLEQQTATSEVLGVISKSPGELQPVFETMLANATRLCDAPFGQLLLREGDNLRMVASRFPPSAKPEWWSPGRLLVLSETPNIPLARLVKSKTIVHVPDFTLDQAYIERTPLTVTLVESAGIRTAIAVPMLKDDVLIGAIIIFRQEVRPFTEKQIELLQNFAAQAVIAIENARLLNELRELLQQQTATSDVLKIISRSTFDLKTVLRTLVESAAQVCEADIGNIALPGADGTYHIEADYGQSAALSEELRRHKLKPGPGGVISRTALSRSTVHILDAQTDPDYQLREALRLGGYHTMLGVPLLREGNVVGVFGLARTTVRPFTEKQIELVTTFADQAVIAIENARLLNELRERTDDLAELLEQQTATSEVLGVISSSPGELEPVFQAMLENATRICEAKFGNLLLLAGDVFERVAIRNTPAKYAEFIDKNPLIHRRQSRSLDRLIETKQAVHVTDMAVEEPDAPIAKFGDARTLLVVPMLKENELVGAIGIYRQEVRPFTDKQIALVQNFAAQAVIAIENTRLLNELRESLQQQTATADVLKVISHSTFDLQVVLDTLVEFGNPAL